MSHIDSGTLHEYLDGELSESRTAAVEGHLAVCQACQTRLDEARVTAQASSELVAELEPGPSPAPAWDELRQRAEARSSGGAGRGNWLKPGLAWAASIALAFVMGWSASNYLQLTPGLSPAQADRSAVGGSVTTVAGEEQWERASPSAERDAGVPAEARRGDGGRAVPSEQAVKTQAEAVDAAPPSQGRRAAEPRNEGALEEKAAPPADAAAGVEAPEREASDDLSGPTIRPSEFRADVPSNVSRPQEAAGVARGEMAPVSPTLAADLESEALWIDALGRAALDEQQKAALMHALRNDLRQRSGFRAAAATLFRTVRTEEAERLLGGPLRTLPDLERRALEMGPGAAVPGAIVDQPVVRAVYEDAAGNQITLVQQRPGQGMRVDGEDEALPTLTVSPSGLVAYRWQDSAGYRLVLIGGVSGDSLRALADRVR